MRSQGPDSSRKYPLEHSEPSPSLGGLNSPASLPQREDHAQAHAQACSDPSQGPNISTVSPRFDRSEGLDADPAAGRELIELNSNRATKVAKMCAQLDLRWSWQ